MHDTQNHYQLEFKQFENNGASSVPAWVHELRKLAIAQFAERGFPTTKEENWRFTNISPISKTPFRYSSNKNKTEISPNGLAKLFPQQMLLNAIVIVDGFFSEQLSTCKKLPQGVIAGSFADALKQHPEIVQLHLNKYADGKSNSFTALNTAFMQDGAFLYIPKHTAIETPIHILVVSSGKNETASFLRTLIVVEEGALVNVLESFVSLSDNKTFTNVVTEIVAKEKSVIEYVTVQRENYTSYHYHAIHTQQEKESSVALFSLALGSAIARNEISTMLFGEACDTNLNGLYITSGEQLIDYHTLMHHHQPNCPSHELFKGILLGKSRAVYNGKVYVEPIAQKTDSKQTNRNLLLSDTATIDTKPELEIFADDVKCTHGATVGGLNEQSMFYLKSRGIGEETARGMLIVGFAAEVTEKIKHETFRRYVDTLVVEHLQGKLGMKSLPDIVHGAVHHE